MKKYRTFKLVYTWTKYAPNPVHFDYYDEKNKRAEILTQLPFTKTSATDLKTIRARLVLELREVGRRVRKPSYILEYVDGGYQFVK